MRPITISESDLAAVAEERYHHPDPRVQRKMTVLWLKHHGDTHERRLAKGNVWLVRLVE
jgi:hypothetical protein